jgi:puromycin-sensitive aminopeptidase
MPAIERSILPDDAVPTRYDLVLEPDLRTFLFKGSLEVSFDCDVATSEISLNAKELFFNRAKFVVTATGKEIEAQDITFSWKHSIVKICFGDDVLPVGENAGKLVISEFYGNLNDQMCGFYRSQYTDPKGKKKWMATTQFEAIDARRCFPCFDEPGRKAVFNVTMIVEKGLTALSNMPEKTVQDLQDGRMKYEFLESPKMSTYLLAFIVGEFDFVAGVTKGGTIV